MTTNRSPLLRSAARAHQLRRAGGAVMAVALAVGSASMLTGCTGHDLPQIPESASPAAPRTPTPIPSLDHPAGVAKDVKIERCDLASGQATASGTLTNSAKQTADFAITIAWLPNNSSDPVAVESTTVSDVAARASLHWSITATLATKADRCTINARRGTL